MKQNLKIIIGVVVVVAAIAGWKYVQANFTVSLPDYPPIQKAVWLEQNWKPGEREWYYHASQGTQTFGIPYEWFMVLEQPAFSLAAAGRLSDPTYLDRFGFIPGKTYSSTHELPVGFAKGGPMLVSSTGQPWKNPQTNMDMTRVGLTCAACHTGRLSYQGTTILIDGGPALTDLDKLRKAMGLSLLFTKYMPFRFDRFAKNILGDKATDDAKAKLSEQLDRVLMQVSTIHKLDEKVKNNSVTEGYARLDALSRIGNLVFALDLNAHENYVSTSAPVHYPRIWNVPWFLWVQYNGSIEQPMVRNAGEALGVGAWLNLINPNKPLYDSSVEVKTLYEMELLIAGKQPDANCGFTVPTPPTASGCTGLKSPKWPAGVFPPINTALAEKGAELYKKICQDCHLAPVTSPDFWNSKRWTPPNAAGERYLNLEQVSIEHVGTDPAQAEDMKKRTVKVPPNLGIPSDFGNALGKLVEKTANQWYDSQTPPISPDQRKQMNGFRENGIRAELAYKVRPLNGIWATPPYLHNGSVPNLYLLLSPAEERPETFYLGHREYDPINVGYRYEEEFAGGFEFDTTIRGNLNTGHEFSDEKRIGVIGRLLTPDQRRVLVEYLKTL